MLRWSLPRVGRLRSTQLHPPPPFKAGGGRTLVTWWYRGERSAPADERSPVVSVWAAWSAPLATLRPMQWIIDRLAGLAQVNVVDVVTLVSLVVAGIQLARAQPRRVIRRYRRRFLHPLGVTARDVDARVAVLLSGVAVSAADEVSWLADRLAVAPGRALPFDAKRVTAVEVEAAYQRYVARLERGILLGRSHVAVVDDDLTRCRGVVAAMRMMRDYRRQVARDLVLEIPHRAATLTLHAQVASDFVVRDIAVSYRRERVVTTDVTVGDDRSTLTVRHLQCATPSEREQLSQKMSTGKFFDWTLPRLIDHRVERDERSGREVLHLALAECTYSAVLLDHYPRQLLEDPTGDPPRSVTGDRVGVLTLSATVVTASGHIVFARRSARAGSHRRRYGPAQVRAGDQRQPRVRVANRSDGRSRPGRVARPASGPGP